MVSRFSREERDVLKSIEELLWTDWDPIGCGVPRDEYDRYAIQAYSRAKRGEAAGKIADYLTEVELVTMGLGPVPEGPKRNRDVAERVVAIVRGNVPTSSG